MMWYWRHTNISLPLNLNLAYLTQRGMKQFRDRLIREFQPLLNAQ